jgi:hypothetical protein
MTPGAQVLLTRIGGLLHEKGKKTPPPGIHYIHSLNITVT